VGFSCVTPSSPNGAADDLLRFRLRAGPDDVQKLQSRASFEDAAPQAHENVQASISLRQMRAGVRRQKRDDRTREDASPILVH